MLPASRRAADVLFTLVSLFHASTVTTTAAQSQDNCVPYNTSSTAGHPEDISIDEAHYFACSDGSLLTAVDATYDGYIYTMTWTCSGDVEDWEVSYTVGITAVNTWVADDVLPLLTNMYFGGYDLDDNEADGASFSWKGPFGIYDGFTDMVSYESDSHCDSGEYATGMTVWASDAYVYGITLECVAVTDTCVPPNYPASLQEDAASSVSPSEDSTPTINDDGMGYTYYYRYSSSEEVISSSADDSSYTVDTGGTTSTYFSSDISSDDGATVSSSADDSSYTVDDDGTSSTDDTSVAPTDDGSKSVSSADDSSYTVDDDGTSSTDDTSVAPTDVGSKSVSSADESSTDSTNKVIAISASVGGALVLIAIVIGVTMCCFRPRCCPQKGETRQHETETPRALPVGEISRVMVKEDGGDKGAALPPQISVIPPPLPPPPHAGPPSCDQETPPPPYYA